MSEEPLTVEIDGHTYIERKRYKYVFTDNTQGYQIAYEPVPLTLDDLAQISYEAHWIELGLQPVWSELSVGARSVWTAGVTAVLAAIGHDLGSPESRKAER